MSDTDFENQLKQEELAKEGAEEQSGLTRVEDDGTVMEWDSEKRAWFPKIDADFIAKYQMTYGAPVTDPSQQSTTDTYTDYYNYYNSYYQGAEQAVDENKEIVKNEASDKTEGTQKDTKMISRNPVVTTSWSGHDFDHYFEQYTQQDESGEIIDQCPEMIEDQDSMTNKKEKKKKTKDRDPQPVQQEGWFEVEGDKNTNIYVSGLPTDITDDEFKEMMNKFGLIMFDPFNKQPKVKLYKDENGEPKGDGRCCYIKVESVELALQLLDESELRGKKIHVERAQFQMKGTFDPSKKRKKLNNKDKRKYKEKQAKLFDWRPEQQTDSGKRFKFEKIVIFKNMFDPMDFEENPLLINELRDDIRAECSKNGDVRKIILYDRHPDGVLSVAFKDAEMADDCIEKMNHRWFAKRRVIAQTWDGVTKYEVEETEAERETRLKKWDTFLGSGEKGKKDGEAAEKNEAVEIDETVISKIDETSDNITLEQIV